MQAQRVAATAELRELAQDEDVPLFVRAKLNSIILRLTCCERDADADGNCPRHPERKVRYG